MGKLATAICLLVFLTTGMASAHDAKQGEISIVEPWARATIGKSKNGVAYLTIVNHGTVGDRLLSVATPVAKKAGLHTHLMEGGMMKMRPVTAVEVKGRASTILKPGGFHVMMMGLKAPLKKGEAFPMTDRKSVV